ncbi:glycosyltransferase [Thiohalorhabdus sp. Cl-TMA]|uniref:Glycosyltransferase n=1 Tax=Thiohalorhabdus methylotrophus TaxID=3242694 RepID=A0ABV4TWU0_9GAMM
MADDTRIAFLFATSGHSGVDRLLRNLVPAIARRGYSVDVLRVRGHGPQLDDGPNGVRVVDLGGRHAWTAFPGLVRYLRREAPSVLVSGKDRINRTAFLARKVARVPVRQIFRFGTTASTALSGRPLKERILQRWSFRHLYPLVDRVLVPSRGVAADLHEAFGVPAEKVRVVPTPVIPEEFFRQAPPRPEHPWFQPGAPPVVLGVGELSVRKDFQTLVRAFARLRRRVECRLVLVGKGRQREVLSTLAEELGVAEDVAFLGFQSNPYAFMAYSHVLALTSRWEGLGFVLIEAMALGTPVVSTDCPSGPRETLGEGRYGPLVEVGDWQGLAEALRGTLQDPLPAEQLQEAVREFEIEAATSRYLEEMGLDPFP